MVSKSKITVQLSHGKPQKPGKVKVVTDVLLRLDGKQSVAWAQLAGKWTEEQALAEFRKNPERFQPQPGTTPEMLKSIARLV